MEIAVLWVQFDLLADPPYRKQADPCCVCSAALANVRRAAGRAAYDMSALFEGILPIDLEFQ